MATRGKVKELARELKKNLNKLSKPRVDLIVLFVLAVSKVGSINLSKIALAMDNNCLKGSNYRRLQRFVKQIDLGKAGIVTFILKLLGDDEPLTLLIDRTNWDFGKKKINILMVSTLYKGYSIPLIWTLLNKKGNSNQGERWDLINSLISKIGEGRIKRIIGDREFGGAYWYKYLSDKSITFVIRIKENQKVTYKGKAISVKNIVKSHCRKGRQCSRRKYEFKGTGVYVGGFRFRNDKNKLEYLIILSQKKILNVSEVYGQRWQIESMFKNMKSNGFNLQDTHLTKDSRLETLIGLIAIAYTWMILTGLMLYDKKPKLFKPKKHGRPAKSIFKAGFEYIMRALLTNNYKDLHHVFKFLSCT